MKLSLRRAQRRICALLVTAGLVAGSVAGAQVASADTVPSATTTSSIGYNLFLMINQERAAHGLYPLQSAPQLRASAHQHNLYMAKVDTLEHLVLPWEWPLGTRITLAKYWWHAVGENIAFNTDWTWSGAQYVENLMYNEVAPNNGHRLNILSTTYRHMGVDVYMDAAHHRMWITVDFGQPI